ncbi:MAG: HTTM domain-containing protein [Alphaproteobacteria bacterium]|nr:HTTM domain-containing protein [Alphaproteobacteria bacterium]
MSGLDASDGATRSGAARLGALWNRLWFAPVPATSVAVLRIGLGLLLVLDQLMLWPQLDVLFDPHGPVSVAAAAGDLPDPRWSWYDLAPDMGAVRAMWAAGLVVFVLFTVGAQGRLMGLLALAVLVAQYQRDPFYQHGGDRVFRLGLIYLSLVPHSLALSVDAWRRKLPSGLTVPVLAHRLIQLQLAVIYMHSGFVKAQGRTWEQGTALYYAMSDGQYARAPWILEPLLRSELFVGFSRVATWVTLVWEAGFGLLLFWKPTRVLAIVIGVLVHGGIFFQLNVGSFSLVMLWCYLSLLSPDTLDRLARRVTGR